jgi:hypothetical protein
MELDTMQTAPTGTNGYGKEALGASLTDSMKAVTGAMALADTAAHDVRQAIEQTRDVIIPGIDVDGYIAGALGAELTKIGYDVTKLKTPRTRAPKTQTKTRGVKA